MRRALALGVIAICAQAQELRLPNKKDSFHFAIIGDTGTGGREQYEIAAQLMRYRAVFPFDVIIMMGDNMYGGEGTRDFEDKFEKPYKPLLDAGVKFYASLGNHDTANQRFYKHFNMNGERWYTFKPRNGIRFFALDSTYMGKEQLAWLEKELAGSESEWKISFFHHPLYSSGKKHGPSEEMRQVLEPILVRNNVSVVFTGHEHFYERIKPQRGIHHFIVGSSAKLRRGNIRRSDITAAGYDNDNAFMLAEIDGDQMHFQAISRKGQVIDAGVIPRPRLQSRARAEFVDATKVVPGVRLDIRYATTNNFTRRKLYEDASCLLRPATAQKLARAQQEFETRKLGLKVFDCYRPLSVQKKLWALVPDERYVADPAKGSRHNRGAAVDVTLVRTDGRELAMPTSYDEFSERAHRSYTRLPAAVVANRSLLESVMRKHGFVGMPTEWWHFDDADWQKYPID